VTEFHQNLEELTAYSDPNGELSLFEFIGKLPRVKLYGNWRVNTNSQTNLQTLAGLDFDPAKTVLVSTPQKGLPAVSTNENSGTNEFTRYSPKHIVFAATATVPAVLLHNDKYDANWQMTVDGQPAELRRCNHFMRGAYLRTAEQHTVEFNFTLPHRPL
jgi:hypothetical protein